MIEEAFLRAIALFLASSFETVIEEVFLRAIAWFLASSFESSASAHTEVFSVK